MRETKRCPRCECVRPLKLFYSDTSECKLCRNYQNCERRNPPISIIDCQHCDQPFVRLSGSTKRTCDDCRVRIRRASQRIRDRRKDPAKERERVRRWKWENGGRLRAEQRRLRLLATASILATWRPQPAPLLLGPGPAKQREQRACQHCERPFTPTNHKQSYCCRHHYLAARTASLGMTAGYCRECGKSFVVRGARVDAYCCDRCFRRNARRRDKKARDKRIREGSRREVVNHAVVAERDGWRCHICKRTVTRDTWSIDHLVPLSAGGDHTYDNIALAHKSCNEKRGARGHAQLLLVA